MGGRLGETAERDRGPLIDLAGGLVGGGGGMGGMVEGGGGGPGARGGAVVSHFVQMDTEEGPERAPNTSPRSFGKGF